MSDESIISKTQLINQGYGSVLSNKETTDDQPRPMPRLSHRRNKYNLENANNIGSTSDINLNVINNNNNLMDTDNNNSKSDIDAKQRWDNTNENRLIQQPSDIIGKSATGNEKKLLSRAPVLVRDESQLTRDNQYSKNLLMQSLTDPEASTTKERPYPKYVFFIICDEFCERFSFYGLRAILVLYFRDVLGFSESGSTISFHLFMTLCYFTPIFGAILGDSIWGKYRTILYLSSVYFLGELLLVISSIIWYNHALSVGLTILSLVLIGSGTGGIKPCVTALSGDQFLTSEQKRIQNFFSMFYFSINAGSLISTFLTPVLRSDVQCHGRPDCFPLAFGVPCILMFVGLVFFVLAKSNYVIVPLPKANVLVSFVKSIYHAIKNKWARKKSSKNRVRVVEETSSSDASTLTVNTMPACDVDPRSLQRTHWIYYALDRYDKRTLDEFRSVLAVLVLFLPLPVFWCLFDQQSSRWTLQATRMDGHIFGFELKPDQIQVANPLLLLGLIPVFNLMIYPLFDKCGVIKTPLQRMTTGGVVAGLTFFASALIEQRIDQYSPVTAVPQGHAHLTVINGMSNCELVHPSLFVDHHLWNEHQPKSDQSFEGNKKAIGLQLHNIDHLHQASLTGQHSDSLSSEDASHLGALPSLKFKTIGPLESTTLDLLHDNNYKLMFNLQSPPKQSEANSNSNNLSDTAVLLAQHVASFCPLDNDSQFNASLPKFDPNAQSKLLYIYQANGEVKDKAFDDNVNMPPAGFARVKIIMDIMGTAHSNMGSLSMKPLESAKKQNFQFQTFDQNLLSTEYLDVDAQHHNQFSLLFPSSMNQAPFNVTLEPGSRNLIIAHEYEPKKFTIKLQQLQDNKYMISILWQLIPYLGISAGEVMFGITGLEFSYSVAPKSMKSIILGAWFLTTAFGNLLTVAVESLHLFDSMVIEYYFYGILMILDMVVFAWLAYYFKSPNSTNERSSPSNSLDANSSVVDVRRTIDSGHPTHNSPEVNNNAVKNSQDEIKVKPNSVNNAVTKDEALKSTVEKVDNGAQNELPSTQSSNVTATPEDPPEKIVKSDDRS